MQTEFKKKIKNIQVLRGVAVLSVVLYHIWLFEKQMNFGKQLMPGIFSLGYLGVDLFFIISGFVMVSVTRGIFQQPFGSILFLYKRITRIYPLYWFYSILLVTAYFILGTDTSSLAINVKAFLLLPQEKYPVLNVGWTLIHEMYFYIIFSFFLFAPEKWLSGLLLLWFLLIICFYLLIFKTQSVTLTPALFHIIHPLTIEFIMGCMIALLFYKKFRINGNTILVIGLLFSIAGMIIYSHDQGLWLRVFLIGLPFSLLILGAVKIESDSGQCFSEILSSIGDASYSTYLSHTLVIMLIARLWKRIPEFENYGYLATSILMLFGSLIYGKYSYKFLEYPILTAAKQIPQKFKKKVSFF